jgi:general secretion pathway protein M
MKLFLPPIASRLLAALLLLLVVVTIMVVVVMPIVDSFAITRLSNEEYRSALARSRVLDLELKNITAQLAEIRQAQSSQSGFLQGANESLATAQLQNRIKSLVEAGGGELRSTQVLPVRDEGKFRRIIVRGQMATNTTGMQHIFYDIESASPYLILDNIDIRARPSPGSPDNSPQDTMLDVRFDIYGYVRGAS